MEIRPVAPACGAEIVGINLVRASEHEFDEVLGALGHHGVVFVRGRSSRLSSSSTSRGDFLPTPPSPYGTTDAFCISPSTTATALAGSCTARPSTVNDLSAPSPEPYATKQNSLPSGSRSTWKSPTSSSTMPPDAVAPAATALAVSPGISSLKMSRWTRFFPDFDSGTR
jgi:hypothetical protein